MGRFKQGQDIHQALLLPPSLCDWLPEGHLAWLVKDTVGKLDVDELLDRYRMSGKGEQPYDPRMMLCVLMYAYSTGVFSSRKIAAKLETDVAFRVLSGNQQPNHRSISRFRHDHLDLFNTFFVQVLQIAKESGLSKFGTIAVDGTKLHANASKHKAMSYERMKEEEAKLLQEIEAIANMAATTDAAEDAKFGADFRGDELPQELARREERLKKIAEAKARLEQRKAELAKQEEAERQKRAEEAGRGHEEKRGRKPKQPAGQPLPKDQENFTDPDSRIMKTSHGFQQCYNGQAAVDEESQLIVATDLSNCAADSGQLVPMVEAARSNVGGVECVLADAGYRSEDNFAALEAAQVDGFIALGREGKALGGVDKERLPATSRMEEKLATPSGRAQYKKRKTVVEPVFGWVKHILGFRALSLRGLKKCAAEWCFICLAINLRRMHALTA